MAVQDFVRGIELDLTIADFICEKCRENVALNAVHVRLAGGVSARLCSHCSTEWDRFCLVHPAFQELRRLESIHNSIVYARELSVDGHDPDLEQVLAKTLECELELHQVGLEWLGREG